MAAQASCMELALEGERLCKAGDCRAGVSFFEAAVQVGTEDLKTLSAVYSQLGNAYFYLQEYEKALEFHRHDLTLARTLGDRVGEAKASGNLGNTLKVLGKFDEAIVCCTRHLDISRELGDKVRKFEEIHSENLTTRNLFLFFGLIPLPHNLEKLFSLCGLILRIRRRWIDGSLAESDGLDILDF